MIITGEHPGLALLRECTANTFTRIPTAYAHTADSLHEEHLRA